MKGKYGLRAGATSLLTAARVFVSTAVGIHQDQLTNQEANLFHENRRDDARLETIGAIASRASKAGIYDLIGNVYEWTTTVWGAELQPFYEVTCGKATTYGSLWTVKVELVSGTPSFAIRGDVVVEKLR